MSFERNESFDCSEASGDRVSRVNRAKKAKKYISKEEISTGCRPVDYL